jgi:hypothetical protein
MLSIGSVELGSGAGGPEQENSIRMSRIGKKKTEGLL